MPFRNVEVVGYGGDTGYLVRFPAPISLGESPQLCLREKCGGRLSGPIVC
jgi:hypothetical protein